LGLVLHRRGGVFLAVAAKLPRDTEVNGAESIFPDVRAPSWMNAWPTARTASSTVPDRTAFCMGASRPSRYCCAKTWMMGMGSSQFWRNGSMVRTRQNFSQRPQCASAARACLAVTPRWVFSWTRPRSVRKASLFAGGTFARALYVERKS
jgi:hypothetical protein